MLKLFAAGICAAAVACPQTRIAVRPTVAPSPQSAPARSNVEAARPLLGYVLDGSNRLKAITGSLASPAWGESLSLPGSTSQAFLPPGQEYALLASDSGLSIGRLSRSAAFPGSFIAGAIAQPDQVAFSPSGAAAVLVSNAERRMQTLTYRSGVATVVGSIGFANRGTLLNLAVSDDGALLVAAFANQPTIYSSESSPWRPVGINDTPAALTFLPRSHDLVLTDPVQNAIVLLQGFDGAPTPARILLPEAGDSNLLAADKQGTHLLAAIEGTPGFWLLDLNSGTAHRRSSTGSVHSPIYLRDGETFLVSAQGPPALIKWRADAPQTVAGAGVR
jgi:hypothetical protein